MAQNPNVLSPLRGKPRGSTNIAVLDIETWGLDATPRAFALGVVYDGHEFHRFTSRSDMLEFIKSERFRGFTFYAHNGGRFDYLCLFGNYWTAFGAENVSIQGSKLYEARYVSRRTEGHSDIIRFRDSFNLIPASLESIGKSMGFPKGHTPDKFAHGGCGAICALSPEERVKFPNCSHGARVLDDEDFAYCERDTEVLYRALTDFLAEFGELRPTLPSTAMAVFRRRFLKAAVWIRRDLDREFRLAYYGGRVECYRLGDIPRPNFYYDINSLFPYAMVVARFPDPSRLRPYAIETQAELESLMATTEGFATCKVEAPDCAGGVPVLPVRREDGRLLFPVGQYEGSWTFCELRAFLVRGGHVRRVLRCVASPPIPSPFAEYVSHFYRMKSEAEGFRRDIAKLLLNGLYGKFGEYHDTKEIYAPKLDLEYLEALKVHEPNATWVPISKAREDGYYIVALENAVSAGHSIYAWAAYITATARVVNLDYQERFRALGCEIYYTDTDSFQCTGGFLVGSGEETLPIPENEELGGLKVEWCKDDDGKKKHPTQIAWIGGNKFYETCCDRKLKGVKKGSEILSVAPDGRPLVFRYRAVRGLKDSIRKNEEAGAPYLIAKHISREYDKRVLFPDGSTRPQVIVEAS